MKEREVLRITNLGLKICSFTLSTDYIFFIFVLLQKDTHEGRTTQNLRMFEPQQLLALNITKQTNGQKTSSLTNERRKYSHMLTHVPCFSVC
jgi:hypothetical protein